MLSSLGFLLLLACFFGSRRNGYASAPSPMPLPSPGDLQPEPWPQSAPSDLPPFPGGWEYDNPPPPDVVARAWQLVDPLWAQGEGATKTEQTGGRWITYRAEIVRGGNKGVTAWRVRSGASSPPYAGAPTAATARAPAYASPIPVATSPAPAPRVIPSAASRAPITVTPTTRGWVPFYIPPAGGLTVAQIQHVLNVSGAASVPLKEDGMYGDLTRAAVVAFQRDHGLEQDGKAGPLTQQAMRPYLNGSPAPAPAPQAFAPSSAPAVAKTSDLPALTNTQIQTALNAAGALPTLVVDGKIGPMSTAAIRKFQAGHGLDADGKVGPLTTAKLRPYLAGLS